MCPYTDSMALSLWQIKTRYKKDPLEIYGTVTLTPYSSCESQDPIFNNAVKAGAVAEPNSKADASNGRS